MKKEYTKAYILSHRGCQEREDIIKIMEGYEIVTLEQVLAVDILFKDKAHFLITKGELTDKQIQTISVNLALVVKPIFEAAYPGNTYVEQIIQTCKNFLEGKSTYNDIKNSNYDIANAGIYDMSADVKYALSSACAAFNCMIDPVNFSADAVFDAFNSAELHSIEYKQRVCNVFYQLIRAF